LILVVLLESSRPGFSIFRDSECDQLFTILFILKKPQKTYSCFWTFVFSVSENRFNRRHNPSPGIISSISHPLSVLSLLLQQAN